MTQGLGDFHLRIGGGQGCGEGAGCMVGCGPGLRRVLFCMQIIVKIKKFNSIKTTGP